MHHDAAREVHAKRRGPEPGPGGRFPSWCLSIACPAVRHPEATGVPYGTLSCATRGPVADFSVTAIERLPSRAWRTAAERVPLAGRGKADAAVVKTLWLIPTHARRSTDYTRN